MKNTPSLTLIQNITTHTAASTAPPIQGTSDRGELIGKIIAMNLRNYLAQESNKALIKNIG